MKLSVLKYLLENEIKTLRSTDWGHANFNECYIRHGKHPHEAADSLETILEELYACMGLHDMVLHVTNDYSHPR